MTEPAPQPAALALRRRLASDVAAGRTVSLSSEEMADPELRRELPALLAGLASGGAPGVGPGLQLPGYTVLGAIGHGGMSTVYLARQERLGRYVALKVAAWSGADRKTRDRLVQEARALARVAHPNIVAIHDIVDVGETVAIALDWIDGLSLEGLLRVLPAEPQPGDMQRVREQLGAPAAVHFEGSPVRFFVRTMLQVARAVHRVHEAGLLHLDVKPSNVLVRRDGTPLLADFGVVREIDLATSTARTFAGTPIYSAPEQLRRDDRGFGPHTDVYGLGITLYEVLARRQPLRDQDLTRLVQTVERGRIPPLGSQIPVAKDLETIVHKAMAPDPRHRYPSAAAFADDLQAFLEGRPVAARPLSRLHRLQRWVRLEPWKAALAAVLLVAVPAVGLLGIELLVGRHHIEAGRLRDRLRLASERQQAAYQVRFLGEGGAARAAALLHEAMELDPSDTSLACLVSMVADDEPDAVGPLLAGHPEAVARSRGLQRLAQKAGERRPFFAADEVAELAASTNPTDGYALALDRVLWAEDQGVEDAYAAATFHLDAAAMGREPDPLLLGLRAWTAALAGLGEVRDAACRVLATRWPDSGEALRWICFAYERQQPEVAARIAAQRIEQDPHDAAAWELWIGGALRTGRHAEGLERLERAWAVPVQSRSLDCFHVLLLAATGQHERARAVRAARPDLDLSPLNELRLRRFEGPEPALAFCRELIAQPRVPRTVLQAIVLEASRQRDLELGQQAFARWQQLYPGHELVLRHEMQRRYAAKDLPGAAQLASQVRTPARRLDTDGPILCNLLVTARDWPALAAFADRWLQHCAAACRPQASFFAGLAASRLGDGMQAARHLAVATAAADASVWHTTALLERAWVLVTPTAPTAVRDPELARLLLGRFEAANGALQSPRRGAWPMAVKAEVAFASGKVEEAVALAEAARQAQVDPRTAPPADLGEFLQEALRRYGR
ncbi:MAG: serine/threonine protein kinase [Planctomycetes bacterium]|nr:serine/threonine protein kinase [Planctomycetota bacterium]